MPPSSKLLDAAVAFSLFLPCFFVVSQGLWPGRIIPTPGIRATDTMPTRYAIILPDASCPASPSGAEVIASLPVYALTIGSALAALAIHLLQVGRARAYYLVYALFHLYSGSMWHAFRLNGIDLQVAATAPEHYIEKEPTRRTGVFGCRFPNGDSRNPVP
ncbi:hypothetical protein PG993_011719 [Apiospora rasikravindrae]|uniref:Uncharacterized protein n=1 Tax=Apiospora rasikravindrae TaxID=990691 RepID=A0ABR1S0K9_9PEZI